jgi:hypothetical protein
MILANSLRALIFAVENFKILLITLGLLDFDTFPIFLIVLLVSPRLNKRTFHGEVLDLLDADEQLSLESSSPEEESSQFEQELDELDEEFDVPDELDDPDGEEGEPADAPSGVPLADPDRGTIGICA